MFFILNLDTEKQWTGERPNVRFSPYKKYVDWQKGPILVLIFNLIYNMKFIFRFRSINKYALTFLSKQNTRFVFVFEALKIQMQLLYCAFNVV